MISQLPLLNSKLPVTVFNQIPLVQLPAAVRMSEAIALEETCQQLWTQEPDRIVLDFSQTAFIDSSGIGSLVNSIKKSWDQGIEMVIWSVHPRVMKTLFRVGLGPFLVIDVDTQVTERLADRRAQAQQLPYHPSVRSRLKRLIDIVGAIVGLAITAIVLIPIAIAIKLDSPGPIFFRQTRCGLMGHQFRLWKFRSMVTNAEILKAQIQNEVEGPFFKNQNDPRITRVGRFLRRTSLDELPQFWNVLIGDMSLVGPRPPTLDEVARYAVPLWRRLNVKPGMTGEWQTSGRSQILKFEDVVHLDLRYQRRWSLVYDLKLIALTLLKLFQKNNGAA